MTFYRDPFSRMVTEFHAATDSTIGETPAFRDVTLRMRLITEEAQELEEASEPITLARKGPVVADPYFPDAVKELADLLYVAFGTAVAWGVDILPLFEEVHRNNMTKASGPRRPDGKILKPEGYQSVDLAPILRDQGW